MLVVTTSLDEDTNVLEVETDVGLAVVLELVKGGRVRCVGEELGVTVLLLELGGSTEELELVDDVWTDETELLVVGTAAELELLEVCPTEELELDDIV